MFVCSAVLAELRRRRRCRIRARRARARLLLVVCVSILLQRFFHVFWFYHTDLAKRGNMLLLRCGGVTRILTSATDRDILSVIQS